MTNASFFKVTLAVASVALGLALGALTAPACQPLTENQKNTIGQVLNGIQIGCIIANQFSSDEVVSQICGVAQDPNTQAILHQILSAAREQTKIATARAREGYVGASSCQPLQAYYPRDAGADR